MNDEYLHKLSEYWQKGYVAANVESWVFRLYGRILAAQLGMGSSKGEKLLDFGCGQCAALQFFKRKGFDVYRVDISQPGLEVARQRMPDIADHFQEIGLTPTKNQRLLGGNFEEIVSIQSLY